MSTREISDPNKMKTDIESQKFEITLNRCVVEALKNILGNSGMQAIIYHLGLLDYASKPEEFHTHLSKVLKDTGATIIEKVIVKELFRTLSLPYFESEPFNFVRYVNLASDMARGVYGV